jgi:Zn-finger nucleic acid-binding protein
VNGTTQALSCPKCGSEMRNYERNGVTVDQCAGCRGIFLDRGELEHLIDAENSHYEREQPQRSKEKGGSQRKSKKRSFLENLLEMGGE